MAIPPASPTDIPQSPSTEPGPSRISLCPSNKRPASVPLSDSETLAIKASQTTSRGMKTKTAVIDAHRRRRRKRKKLSITQSSSQVSQLFRVKSAGSLKGKEREVDGKESSCDKANEATPAVSESDELDQLRTKLDEQASLLNAHKEFITALAPSITCQICLDPMYRPYTLAPCGHTACYDCLLAWFRAPPAHVGLPPPGHLVHNFDRDEPTLLARDAPMLLRKEKTCPHCRAVVRDAPVEAWGIKDIVNHLFAHKGDVAKDLYPTYTRLQESNQTGPVQTGADAWRGVFKRERIPRMLAVTNGHQNDRAGPMHDDDGQTGGRRPFYDEEDNIFRCTECYHEIVTGLCTHCGRLYPGYYFDPDDEDEELDAGHWMDAEEFDGLAGDPIDLDDEYEGPEVDGGLRGFMGALGFRRPRAIHPEHGHDDEDDEDEAYESSFIDDDDDDRTRMDEYHSAEEAGTYESEDEEMRHNDEGDREEDHLPRRVPPPHADGSDEEAPPVHIDTIEVLGSDSDESVLPVNHHREHRNRIRIDSDDDDVGELSPRARRPLGLPRARRPIVDDSDSEQEEDEHVGRQRFIRRYARSLSNEDSLLDDGSDHSSQHGSFRDSVSGLSHENYENYAFSDEEDIMWSD